MNPDHWQRLEFVFHEAADLPAGPAREARLDALCQHDQALRTEVEALLAEDEVLHDRSSSSPPAVDPHLGMRLGAYQVDRLVARGGMAAVYEARRADDTFEQRVAVKIMDLRVSDPVLVAQFGAERQILAALEHPSLTRLLDGGVTSLGEPYLVMEYVDGVPVDRYCDTQRLDVEARVRLFLDVCEGVAFAHRTLVLHRDLKPSNILVTPEGHVKVVDFGTATLLQPDRLSTTSLAPLTPAYASPEQLTGGAVGTASDQYSLGLVLFELLTGGSPFGTRPSLIAAMERALAGTTTVAPHATATAASAESRRTTLARLRRVLSGDLGTVVCKALAPDAAGRYSSVQHLADDLTRWLDGAPIAARPASLAYRTTRFVRRHWAAVSVAGVLAAGLVVATGVSLQQAARAREQARVAQDESAKARQLNRFLTRMLSSANPSWFNANGANAGSITVRHVLDGAGQLIGQELGGTPAVEAEMQRTLGRTYLGFGATDQALPHLERARALYASLGDEAGVAFSDMLLGEARLLRGEYAASEGMLRKVMEYVRSRADSVDPELHFITVNDLSVAISYQRPADTEALSAIQEAIAVADRTGVDPRGASIASANLATSLARVGRLNEAVDGYRDAVGRMQALPVPPAEMHGVRSNLSILLRQLGRVDEALREAEAAVAGASKIYPDTHVALATLDVNLGRALAAAGQFAQARDALLSGKARFERLRPAGHPERAIPLVGLGIAYRGLGRLTESEQALREARRLLAPVPALKERSADAAGELGLTLRAMGKGDEAEALLAESHATYQASYGDAHPLTTLALTRVRGGER